jgi:hypothetical protein
MLRAAVRWATPSPIIEVHSGSQSGPSTPRRANVAASSPNPLRSA